MRKRVFLLDDHPLVREWLASMIAHEPDLEVCGQAEDAPSAFTLVSTTQPDVIIVDLSLPRGSGLDFIKEVRGLYPAIKLLVLSMHDEVSVAERAFRAGANGFTVKRESGPSIIQAIRAVLDGKFHASPALMTQLAGRIFGADVGRRQTEPEDAFSDRELEVFRLRGQGQSPKEIAHRLGVSVKTIASYEARMKEKLGVTESSELIRRAVIWHERQRVL